METILCGDIGGTHANLCLSTSNGIEHIKHLETASYENFESLILDYLQGLDQTPEKACLAVAGMLKHQRVEMTNAKLVVDAKKLEAKTPLKKVVLINDFLAVGWAVNCLSEEDIILVKKENKDPEGAVGCIGAGTGLGKCFLTYDKEQKMHVPHPSEGGHSDFAAATEEEWELVKAQNCRPSYETFLSGKGIARIYDFLQKRHFPNENPRLTGKEVSHSQDKNACSKHAMKLFSTIYARAAKNFALDLFATGGIYIAGGIAAQHPELFGEVFLQEFCAHANPHYKDFLCKIPITLIRNYDISLKGAAFAAKRLL